MPSETVNAIVVYPTPTGVILRFRLAPLPVTERLATGTTPALLLPTVTLRLFTGVSVSAKVKSMPKVRAGSVGSLITPLTADALRKAVVLLATTMVGAAEAGKSLSVMVAETGLITRPL